MASSETPAPAEAGISRRDSLLHGEILQRNSFAVIGPSNVPNEKDDEPTVKTMHANVISLEDLKQLLEVFQAHDNRLTRQQFEQAMTQGLSANDTRSSRAQLSFLFDKMDTNNDGLVEWDELCTYVLADLQEHEGGEFVAADPLSVCPHLVTSEHLLPICTVTTATLPPRFITASEEGTICFWNPKMDCIRTFSVDAVKSSRQLRVTAVQLMPNAFRIAVATTNRDICFYDTARAGLCNRLSGLPNIVCTLQYVNEDHQNGTLVMGDLGGCVSVLNFKAAAKQLFNKPVSAWQDGVNVHLRTLADGPKGKSVVSYQLWQTHEPEDDDVERSVRQLRVTPERSVITCAATSRKALVIRSLQSPTLCTEFHIQKGVNAFDHNQQLNLLVTAGADATVRLWNPMVPKSPLAMLKGHPTAISHVFFNVPEKQIVSLGTNEEIRIWDMSELTCVNTLSGLIPHRPGPTTPGQKIVVLRALWHDATQSLITAAASELAVVQLHRTPESTERTHPTGVKCMLLVPEYNQIITADESGEMCSWSLDNGEKLLQFSSPHGKACVTALALGANGKRFVSGASDGTCVVWNLLSGTALQLVLKDNTKEITGLLSLRDRFCRLGRDAADMAR
eukprot:m.314310 g.314310  ORF g.314310 m.314310 type:complete len:620 (-) comp19667_c0_seq9:1341-3200(-)